MAVSGKPLPAIEPGHQLTEQACMTYHGLSSLSGLFTVIGSATITLPYKEDFFQ
jgi:hypothetical protein